MVRKRNLAESFEFLSTWTSGRAVRVSVGLSIGTEGRRWKGVAQLQRAQSKRRTTCTLGESSSASQSERSDSKNRNFFDLKGNSGFHEQQCRESSLRKPFSVFGTMTNISMDAPRSADRVRVRSISHLSYPQTPYHRRYRQGSKVCGIQEETPTAQ